MRTDHVRLGFNARADPAGFVAMHAAGVVSLERSFFPFPFPLKALG